MIVISLVEEGLYDLIIDRLLINYDKLLWAGNRGISFQRIKRTLYDYNVLSLFIVKKFTELYHRREIVTCEYIQKYLRNYEEPYIIISIERKSFEFINALDNT